MKSTNYIAAAILGMLALLGFLLGYTVLAIGTLVLAILFVFRPVKGGNRNES